ncbi:uncharacterized protein EI90DRAFT_2907774 [Cantharellus anzutake]|uniref:uncharacterized protein n=1 Tax=Cantharellus anzutake TaxID=1750568 RepID=UPI001906B8C4|nr:uncharacterized protein EI90DRAFT_2907774 [Cantharellus anzutake]KAF8339675.1 hypothetical protein EI90DRAFT_2907774 [Cantharellus anzutake]
MSLVPNNYGPGSYIGPSVDDVSSFQSRPIRTPSPTPSELIEEKQPFRLINWKVVANYRSWFTRRAIPWIIAGAVFFTIIILMSVFHRQIVDWLTPFSRDLKKLPAGWVIPIIILFVLSFPPLFGHEIVAILCGVVWGLWVGFGIVAVGTLLGEIGNFYAFRYLLTKRGEKLERTNLKYAALAKLIRRGGYLIPIVARFSAIPGHFTTAVFSTCGMNIWVFIVSATVSLPKQLTTVYLGVIIEESSSNTQSKKSKIISDTVLIVSILITIIAAWWIFREMTKVKPEVMRDMRRRRAMQKWEIENSSNSTDRLALHAFNADDSDEEREAGMRQPVPLRMESQRYDVDEPLQTNQLYDPSPIAGKVRFQERAGRQSGEDLTWDPANDGGSTVYSLKPQYVARNQTSDLEDQSTSTPL